MCTYIARKTWKDLQFIASNNNPQHRCDFTISISKDFLDISEVLADTPAEVNQTLPITWNLSVPVADVEEAFYMK